MSWTRWLARVEAAVDRARAPLRQRDTRPTLIVPYLGYGTPGRLHLRGRVLRDNGLALLAGQPGWRTALRASYRRFGSAEIPGVSVRLRLDAVSFETQTDEEGYFVFDVALPAPLSLPPGWHAVTLALSDDLDTQAQGAVLIPSAQSQRLIISDIDDTVLQTHATQWSRMLRLTLLRSAHEREPFPGVATLYRGLQQGVGQAEATALHPVFYLSSSPWNLYDLLVDFLEHHAIPLGPLLLRDLGIDDDQFIAGAHHDHKYNHIADLLRCYPTHTALLLGDSGQHDEAIYAAIARDFPGRIEGIYIRDVRPLEAPLPADAEVPLLRTASSTAMAHHAAEHGWLDPQVVAKVAQDAQP
ncbi:MAG: phosphatase domain-containing protein [Bacteroidota bacterium]